MSLLSAERELTRNSYYAATAPRERSFPALQADVDCDVAVVGAGFAGLSAAIELADRGMKVVVLEAREVGWGASGRNGGQVIAGLACEQTEIEQQLGLDDSRKVWDMTLEAIALIAQRRQRFGIECDWQPGYLSLADSPRKARELQAWQVAMGERYGHVMPWISPADMPKWIASPRFHGGVHDPLGGHLHPLKYCLGLARAAASLGVTIHEQSAVLKLEPGTQVRLRCTTGSVRAAHVLLAGNVYLDAFAPGLAPSLAPRIMPVGTYIVASEPLTRQLAASLIPSRSAVCDTNFVLDYFRTTADDRLLYGGRVSYSTATPANLDQSMQRRMAFTFPQLNATKIDYAWGGFVDISMKRAPDFGRLPGAHGRAASANVYYLQGFSGHGVALTGLAGRLVAEAIAGDAQRFDVFARIRQGAFPGGRLLRTPALVAGMAYYRLRDLL
jgi:gamma-glutamylputrescine oxidase